ncbi:protein CHUP1, chloroplastic-like isoform X2 [Cornus florida]|nr:protein CHUP1, chloroplastic-like isoform X2 [Cornus florida]
MSKKVKSEMEQRRVSLEVKLVELNGLKEHQLHMAELQKHLKAKTAEIDMLTATIIALQAERKKLYEEIKQNKLAEKQVEIAKKMILEMQAKKRVDADQMKGQLVMLQEQVNGFHMEETTKIVDAKVEKKLESMKDVELEIVRKKRRNKELQLEKRELSVMLAAAQAKITALSNMTERKILVKMEEELSSLRLVNENLRKQAERLQKNRFEMVEELVYQRWLNTCLRLEVQDYKTPRQSISSSDSHEKTSKLSFDYNFDSISSNAFTSESDKITTTTIDSSSTNQTSVHKKYGLIQYIKRWGRSRYDTSAAPTQGRSPPSRKGLIRRFSTSMVPEKTSMLKTKGDNATQTPETPSLPRKRRVSFNDSIQTAPSTFQDSPESVRGASDDERKSGQSCEDNRSVNTIAALEEEEPELSSLEMNVLENNNGSSNSSRQEMESEEMESRVVSKIDVPPSEKEVGNRRVHFVAAFFFLLLMLVVCFVFHTGGIYYLVPMVVVCNILFKTIGMY